MQTALSKISLTEKIFDGIDASENTISDYKARIGLFFEFVRDNGFGKNSFRQFKRYLAEQECLKTATKQKYLIVAKRFLKEMHFQYPEALPMDITIGTRGFATGKLHKKDGLNNEEIERLSRHVATLDDTLKNARLKAIMALLMFQGLRTIEIVRLDVDDAHFASKTLFVKGKGKDDKEKIHLHPEAIMALKEYLKHRIGDGTLFPPLSNNAKSRRMTTKGMRKIICGALKELEIEKSPHGFRHYFTTTLINDYKGDLLSVMKHTRHSRLETLQIYYDEIKLEADLPRFYKAFQHIHLFNYAK